MDSAPRCDHGLLIVRRYRLASPANVQVYDLTEWGRDAAPVMPDLGRWAARSPRHDARLFMSAASAMMSLQALIDPVRAGEMSATIAFHFPGEDFVATLRGGEMLVRRGGVQQPDLAFTGDTLAMRRTIYGKAPLVADGADGTLAFEGEIDLARAFVDFFHLPAKKGPPSEARQEGPAKKGPPSEARQVRLPRQAS